MQMASEAPVNDRALHLNGMGWVKQPLGVEGDEEGVLVYTPALQEYFLVLQTADL